MTAWLFGADLGTAGTLAWTGPPWMVALVGLAAIVVLVVSMPGHRPLGWRVVETAGLLVAASGVVAAVARPVWIEEEGRVEPGRVVVLVDGSRSMDVLEGGVRRSEAVAGILERIDDPRVEVLHFGDDLRAGAPVGFDLPGTDLEGALAALSERVAGERLAAVVVISDGLDRSGLRRRFRAETAPAPPDAPGPISVFQVGAASDLVDLGIRSVDSGGFAFLRNPFQIRAEVVGTGRPGVTVPVSLDRDGVPISTRTVQLDASGVAEAVFDVIPPDPGRFTYTVSVPIWNDDAVPGNNTMPIVVRVVRDRMRVLQVAGAPSWDVKMLRRFLKEDPSIDLVSFFILRTPRDMDAGWDEDELSLIQFPHEKLFTEELWSFDLVIFQNFDHEPYFSGMGAFGRDGGRLLDNVGKFVREEGKGFVMIGGPRSFDLGAYDGTAVGDILPLRLGVEGPAVLEPPFAPTLTDAGRRHPITRLVDDAAENDSWWARLHPQDGMNVTLGPAPGAAVLLVHPTAETADGAPLPVLAVREVGAGRSMALAVDASWRWSFSEAAVGRGNQAYLRFWKNAMRWLVKDPATGRVVATTARENYGMGETVRVSVRVRDEAFDPVDGAEVTVEVTGPGDAPPLTQTGLTTGDGEVVLEWTAERQGAHRVRALARVDGHETGTSDTVYAVTTRDPELDEVVPDAAFLRWLAERGGGRYHAPGADGPIVRDASAGRTVWDRRESDLSRAPLLAALVLTGAGASWMARRRAGLR